MTESMYEYDPEVEELDDIDVFDGEPDTKGAQADENGYQDDEVPENPEEGTSLGDIKEGEALGDDLAQPQEGDQPNA
jgi:hypothetical protein